MILLRSLGGWFLGASLVEWLGAGHCRPQC